MEQEIRNEICRVAREHPKGRFPGGDALFFDEPLVGFAAAADPLFTDFKKIIGSFHLTPQEIMQNVLGVGAAATVISWILPVTRPTRESNGRERVWPSREWAQTRNFGEELNVALRRHLVAWLEDRGHRAMAPQLAPAWKSVDMSMANIPSPWSERHAAYVAGLGTFSLNDALITPKGIAHRVGSVVTDLTLAPTPRPEWPDHRWNCLFHREGTCGACIGRCPVGAITREGHDKTKCRDYVYGAVPRAVGELYGTKNTGCGLCQTRVPCEGEVPPGRRK